MAFAISQVRHNYHPDCEAAVNSQIQLQLFASYTYLSMAFYCDRDDVALAHFASFFLSQSHQWRSRAENLLRLQNQRGGRISLGDISKPDLNGWQSGFLAMECSFHLEMTINESLLELHRLASDKGDTQLCEFLRRNCLHQQVETLKELGGYLTSLRNMGAPEDSLAEYLFEKLTLKDSDKD